MSTLAVIGVTTLIGTGLAVATGVPSTPAPQPTTQAVPQVLVNHFAVFRSGPTTESEAAAVALRNFAVGINEQFGLNVALARRVGSSDSPVWIVPGGEGICIFRADSGHGGCTSTQNALAGNLQITDGSTVVGVAPDGNPSVTVEKSDGATESVGVQDNVYTVQQAGATLVDIVDGSGQTQHVALP